MNNTIYLLTHCTLKVQKGYKPGKNFKGGNLFK